MYRIDRPPEETVGVVKRALRRVNVDAVYVEGNVVMGTIEAVDGRTTWVVEVDLGVPAGAAGTLISVAVRLNDDLTTRRLPTDLQSAPQVGREVVAELRAVAGEDFFRVPGPENEPDAAAGSGWDRLRDAESFADTGMRSLGRPVYETTVGGRTVTVEAVRPERHDAGRSVAVSTPLGVARAGTGFECYFDDEEFTRYDYGDRHVEVDEETWRAVRALDPFGVLTVDDRVGVVEHVLTRVVTDPDALSAHADGVTSLAAAVEYAVEAQV